MPPWCEVVVPRQGHRREAIGRSSPAFVRAPEGNGVAERFVHTLKENLLWVQNFATLENLHHALLDFKRTYNETWIIQRHDY